MPSNNQIPTVLFVDDEIELLSAFREYFEPVVSVCTASNGAEALDILQKSCKPDVIVSDQRMKGMLGIEFLEKSIAISPDSERILMTGYNDVTNILRGISRAKISSYITKPVDFQQLRLMVEQFGKIAHLRRQNDELARQLNEANSKLEDTVTSLDIGQTDAYNRLKQLQRAREQMVRMAVHDLKAPLGNIELILSELLQQDISASDFQELVGIARQSVHIMRNLVDDMLTVAMLTQPEFNPPKDYIQLSPYMRHLAATFRPTAEKKQIELILDLPDNMPTIYAAPAQIQQLIYNLLSNAVKYTPVGGKVFFSMNEDRESIVISVRDTGLGMTENDIQNAFQEFQRLSARPTSGESSTGLGLFIVKKMVELNGGTISISSDGLNKGTSFTVLLPKPSEQP